jgi:hypothetical protein
VKENTAISSIGIGKKKTRFSKVYQILIEGNITFYDEDKFHRPQKKSHSQREDTQDYTCVNFVHVPFAA